MTVPNRESTGNPYDRSYDQIWREFVAKHGDTDAHREIHQRWMNIRAAVDHTFPEGCLYERDRTNRYERGRS